MGHCDYIIIRDIFRDRGDISMRFKCVVLPNLKIEGEFH